jgi:hypothetical protein
MENVDRFEDDETPASPGDAEFQSVIRRQLVGSLIAAAVIAVVAGLIAVRPARVSTAEIASNRSPTVQQPSFVVPPEGHVAAVIRHPSELP